VKLLALAGDADELIPLIRLRNPLEMLAQQEGWSFDLRSFHDCPWALLAQADVLIVQRGLSARALGLQRMARHRGAAVIYEIDDLLTDLPAHISNRLFVQAAQPWLVQCLANCDLVTVSTERLALELAVSPFAVVPNAAWPPELLPIPAARPGEPVSLLLASTEQLATDFLFPALQALSGSGVQIVAVGPPAQRLAAAGIPVRGHDLMPREQWIPWVRQLPNAVAVIPLESSRFAACKSAIKWFEYSHAGIPVLASAVSPYADVIEDGLTGALVANSAVAWEVALRRAIGDVAWRTSMARAAQADVRERFSVDHMLQAWRAAIAQAQALRQQTMLPRAGVAERLRWHLWRALEAPRLALRSFNRQRLAARRTARR
jgi:glycosyltransferase involved in cell wall biosynthesis